MDMMDVADLDTAAVVADMAADTVAADAAGAAEASH